MRCVGKKPLEKMPGSDATRLLDALLLVMRGKFRGEDDEREGSRGFIKRWCGMAIGDGDVDAW